MENPSKRLCLETVSASTTNKSTAKTVRPIGSASVSTTAVQRQQSNDDKGNSDTETKCKPSQTLLKVKAKRLRGKTVRVLQKAKRGLVKDDPSWMGCLHWLRMKNRYCKFPRLQGAQHCGHHGGVADISAPDKTNTSNSVSNVHNDSSQETTTPSKNMVGTRSKPAGLRKSQYKRVPCPIDPTHDVYEHRLRKHMQRCPKLKQRRISEAKPYFRKDHNRCSVKEAKSTMSTTPCQSNDTVQTETSPFPSKENKIPSVLQWENDTELFIENVNALYRDNVTPIEDSFLSVRLNFVTTVGLDVQIHLCGTYNLESQITRKYPAPCCFLDFLQEQSVWLGHARENGGAAKKHFRHEAQQASILENMRAFQILPSSRSDGPEAATRKAKSLLQPQTTYIEFGAGRAKLSLALCTEIPGTHVLLIERAGGISMKADSKLREAKGICERLRIDIADLDLTGVASLKCHVNSSANSNPSFRQVVGISKHLCGPATDLAINCVCNFARQCGRIRATENAQMKVPTSHSHIGQMSISSPKGGTVQNARASHQPVQGIAFALCCHHRLTWKEYCGKDFFINQLGTYSV